MSRAAAKDLNWRVGVYQRFNDVPGHRTPRDEQGGRMLTPRQYRRAHHKRNHAEALFSKRSR